MARFVLEIETDDGLTGELFGGPMDYDSMTIAIEAALSSYGATVERYWRTDKVRKPPLTSPRSEVVIVAGKWVHRTSGQPVQCARCNGDMAHVVCYE